VRDVATLDDLIRRSARDPETGCLRWTGAHTPKGYGQIVYAGKARAVHRVAYEAFVGPIPRGHDIDHVHFRGCRHRDCIEPSHLEAVTHAENVRRTVARQTRCRSGHEFTPDNTWVRRRDGYMCRVCKTCHREDKQRRTQRLGGDL